MNKITPVYAGRANWDRPAYLKLVDDKVVFDCSDEEYGPIEFDLNLLKQALSEHLYSTDEDISVWDVTLMDGLEDEFPINWHEEFPLEDTEEDDEI